MASRDSSHDHRGAIDIDEAIDANVATSQVLVNQCATFIEHEQYVEGFEPPFRGDPPKKHQAIPISRPNFLELCDELVEMDEEVFEQLYRRLGLSVDWTQHYATIDERSRRVSQQAFLNNVRRGEAYSQEAPTLWDIDFRTAVAETGTPWMIFPSTAWAVVPG